MNYPILSVVIWLPIAAGLVVLAVGDRHAGAARVIALVGAIAGLLVALPLWTHFDRVRERLPVHRVRAVDRDLQRQLPPRHRRHVAAADPAQLHHHRAGGDRRLGGDPAARRAVHGGVPDPVGADERRVLRARRAAVLRVLRGDADPDVHRDRRVGRAEPRLCGGQVLPLYADGLAAVAGRADLPVQRCGRQFLAARLLRTAAAADRADSDFHGVSWWRSRSRCRCGRCIPGCPMRTSRRRPAARWCWRRSC